MRAPRVFGTNLLLGAAALLAIAGCGGGGSGGGGETLTVSIRYDEQPLLFRAVTIQPVLTGFNGHSPQCSLKSGSVPPGMTLHSDCSVSGTPTQLGTFNFVVLLGASGVSNQIDWTLSLAVSGPVVSYLIANPTYYPGDVVVAPNLSSSDWVPIDGETVVFALESGALPPGLVLNPATGDIWGTIADAPGDYSYTIAVYLQHGTDVARTGGAAILARVLVPTFSYPDAYPSDVALSSCAFVTEPFTLTPRLPRMEAGSTLAFVQTTVEPLPDGLLLDAATGTISGDPTTLSTTGPRSYWMELTVTPPGGGTPVVYDSAAVLFVCSPFDAYYLGATLPAAPIFHWGGPHLSGFTYAYAPAPGCTFVAGVSLDPSTGVISGTHPAGSFFTTDHCVVQITATHAGVPFVVNAGIN